MRQGQQNRRGRGRNRKGQNPLSRSFESNGPGVKIRGTAAHIAEKYMSLARDAQSSGDSVQAENYLQHAEHYNRIIMAAQSQLQQPMDGMNGNGGRLGSRPGEFMQGDDAGEGDWEEPGEPAGQMGFGQPQHQQGGAFGQPRDPFSDRDQRDHRQHREPREYREGGQQRYTRQPDYGRQPQPAVPPQGQSSFADEQPELPRGDLQRGPGTALEGEGGIRGEGMRPPREEREGGYRERRRQGGEEGGFRQPRRRRHGGNGGQHGNRDAHGGGSGFANGMHDVAEPQQPQPQPDLAPQGPKDGSDGTPA